MDPNESISWSRPDTLEGGGVWVPGGPRGLQNRRGGDELPGGFDSRPPPLRLTREVRYVPGIFSTIRPVSSPK
jgi:hypothetical protein